MDQIGLVDRARRGDRQAFAELVRATGSRLDATARLIFRDPDLAQDAVQDTLIRAWTRLPGAARSTIDIAPNGRELAFEAFDYNAPTRHISIAALDQSTFRTFYDVQVTDHGGIQYLAPDGRELGYLALASNGHTHDIRAPDVTTGETRPIVETSIGNDIVGDLSASPDGQRIAYALESVTGAISVHVVGTDGRGDAEVGHLPGATFEAWPQWDPQGHRLLIERDAGDGVVHPVIVDLDGGPDVVIHTTISSNGAGKTWAPDGSAILAQRIAEDGRQLQQELWNARTGAVTPVSWPSVTPPSWQRVAR